MINSARKKMKPSFVMPLLFGKFYNPDINIENSDTVFKMTEELEKIIDSANPEKLIIVHSDYEKIPKEFSSICMKNELRIIDLNPLLNEYLKNGQDLNYWKTIGRRGHWNHKGHEVIGKFLSEQLETKFNINN